jgi:hypothetical protein
MQIRVFRDTSLVSELKNRVLSGTKKMLPVD